MNLRKLALATAFAVTSISSVAFAFEVRAYNDEGKTFPLAVKDGDRILFGKYSGTEIKIDGEDFIIMKEEEVLGILTGAATPAKKELAGSKK